MALVDVAETHWPSTPLDYGGATTTLGVTALDAASEYVALLFKVKKTQTIVGVDIRLGTVTTGSTLDIQLRTVDMTSGFPGGLGALYHANATGTCIVATTDAQTVIKDGHGGGAPWGSFTITKDDWVAIVISQPATAFGNLQIGSLSSTILITGVNLGSIYGVTNISGAAVKNGIMYMMSLEVSDGSYVYIPPAIPYASVKNTSFHSTTTFKELGGKITSKFNGRCSGVRFAVRPLLDITVRMYSSDLTTILASAFIDADVRLVNGGGNGVNVFVLDWGTPVTLTAGQIVYVVAHATTNTANNEFSVFTALNAAAMSSMTFKGACVAVYRGTVGSGVFTEEALEEPMHLGLVFDQLHDGAGGAGGGLKLVGPGGLAG